MELHADYVIIGGGIAGTTAAETIRQHDSRGKVVLLGEENNFLYSRVLLPSYLQGRIPRDKVFLRKLQDYTNHKIDLYMDEHVRSVDPVRKEIETENGEARLPAHAGVSTSECPTP